MQQLGLEVLLDDDCVLSINKPNGLPTQSPREYDSVERQVRAWLAGREADKRPAPEADDQRPPYLGIPHRLDRPASGVLLLAKSPRAARIISRQFERRQIQKTYWTLVSGRVEPQAGTWQDYVRKLPSTPKVEIVPPDAAGALLAVLHYRVIGHSQSGSLLEIQLETGRTHQIRIQAASRGHPVAGDWLYGSTVSFGTPVPDERERAIALHARSVVFRHPTSGERSEVTAQAPQTWRGIAEFAADDAGS